MGIRYFLGFVVFVFFIGFVSSAHYITGYVNDALDGEIADGHVVVLYNDVNGLADNLTDVIGVGGNSGYTHTYMIDCELLNTACVVGDNLTLKVIDSGDGYISREVNVTVTVSGYDMVDNLTINSPPSVGIASPDDNYLTNQQNVDFVCNYSDLDSDLGYVDLVGNFSGSWGIVGSRSGVSGNVVFSETLGEGEYSYYCKANDSLVSSFSSNRSVVIDLTSPNIYNFTYNDSSYCGSETVRFECLTNDYYGISFVYLQKEFGGVVTNYTMSYSGGVYFYDLLVSDVGDINFSCYSEDNAGNFEVSFVLGGIGYSGFGEIGFGVQGISFNPVSAIEGENVLVDVNVSNSGCVDSGNFSVSFYRDEINSSNFLDSVIVSLGKFSSGIVSSFFDAKVGPNNIFVYLDSANNVSESEEGDNIDNKTMVVTSWQEFYGNVTGFKLLYTDSNFTSWGNFSSLSGNIFVTDSESVIDWSSLVAIGKRSDGGASSGDFSEIDDVLGTLNYNDSVSSVYSSHYLRSLVIRNRNISDVPFVDTTNNSSFGTGILWDSSDSSDLEFDSVEGEDLVFVSTINKSSVGEWGVYDYEIKIPVKLRDQTKVDISDVYFYYEIE